MAAIQNLEVVVEVNIGNAIAALTELQDELSDLADDIEKVDARGSEGIDINTDIDQIDSELAALEGEIQAFERANSVDLASDIDGTDFSRGGGGSQTAVDTMNVLADDVRIIGGEGFNGFGGGGSVPTSGMNVTDDIADAIGGDDGRRPALPGGDEGDNSSPFSFIGDITDQFGELRERIDGFNLRMSDLHNVVASIVPVLLVFIGAIPAAYTALMTLAGAAMTAAAAFAVMGGLGAIGFATQGGDFSADRLQEAWSQISNSFFEAFTPLAERLQPLFEDALDGLGRFFQAIADQGDALMALTDEARAFGGFLMNFVPQALRTLAGLVEAMSSIFSDIGSFLENNFNGIIRGLVHEASQAIPVLGSIAQKIIRVLPALARMSVGFMKVTSVIIDVLSLFGRMMGLLGISPQMFGLVVGGLLAIASAVAIANIALKSFVFGAIASAIQGMYAWFYSTILMQQGLAAFAVNTLARAIVSIYGYITSLVGATGASLSMASATMIATGALAAFLTLASLGVLAGVAAGAMGIANQFLGVADSIDQATSSMEDFNRVSGKTDGNGFNPYGGGGPGGSPSGGSGAYTSPSSGSGTTNVNIESTGDSEKDQSNGQYAFWRTGRTTGGGA